MIPAALVYDEESGRILVQVPAEGGAGDVVLEAHGSTAAVAPVIEVVDAQRPAMLAAAQDAMRFANSVGNGAGDLDAAALTSVVRAQARIIYDLVRSIVAAELRLTGDPQAAQVVTSTVLEG